VRADWHVPASRRRRADDESKNENENARLATARFSFARGSVLKKMAVVDAVRGGVVA
jgi:hypothetical protein